jgi:ribosomal protein S12 methylthiotransferase
VRFWIDLHGCAKNQVDAEEMTARLEAAGHSYVSEPEGADLIIVNTCGFVEDAKRESIDAVMSLRAAHPDKRILVAGCLAQRYASELAAGMPEADGILGNADLGAVVAAAERTIAGERPLELPPIPPSARFVRRSRLFDFPGTAHVKITEGCSNHCSYCAIPLIRGELRSRPPEEVVAECAVLVRPPSEGGQGVRELVLIGQDLGSYGMERGRPLLPELLERLSSIPGDFRVRTLYIHPDHFPEGILPIMAADPRILPYFDLPFQHASARILKAMNRRGDPDTYLRLLERIRSALPDAAIRSTFLVGFPGEQDADFNELRSFQERAQLDWAGAFAYSREEGTDAYAMRGRPSTKIAAARKTAVEEAQERITRERLGRFVGRELPVLVEERVAAPDGAVEEEGDNAELCLARAWNQAPDVDGLTVLRGAREPGSMVRARILSVAGVDFDAVAL